MEMCINTCNVNNYSLTRTNIIIRLFSLPSPGALTVPSTGALTVRVANDIYASLYVKVGENEEGRALMPINRELAASWGKTAKEIYNEARYNLYSDYELKSMRDTLAGMGMPEELPGDIPDMMWVLTNKRHSYGAANILSPDIMREAKEKIGNFLIIPSSIHEAILVKLGDDDVDNVNDIINEVNTTEVAPEEILSDRAYKYDFNTNRLYEA